MSEALPKFYTYVPDLRSETTEGLMQRGATRILVRIRSSGLATSDDIRSRGMSCGNKIIQNQEFFFEQDINPLILLGHSKRSGLILKYCQDRHTTFRSV